MHLPSGLPPLRRLSEDLVSLATESEDRAISFNQLLRKIRGRGFPALMFLMALPFILPVPLPGLSTPFGAVLFLFGARIATGRRPLIPRRLLRQKIKAPLFKRLLDKAVPLLRWIEDLLHPRWVFLSRPPFSRPIHGLVIMANAFALALPLPIPFTNSIPGAAIVLLAAGMMEEDGLFILLGYLMTIGTAVYFTLLAWAGHLSLDLLLK